MPFHFRRSSSASSMSASSRRASNASTTSTTSTTSTASTASTPATVAAAASMSMSTISTAASTPRTSTSVSPSSSTECIATPVDPRPAFNDDLKEMPAHRSRFGEAIRRAKRWVEDDDVDGLYFDHAKSLEPSRLSWHTI